MSVGSATTYSCMHKKLFSKMNIKWAYLGGRNIYNYTGGAMNLSNMHMGLLFAMNIANRSGI